MDPSFEHDLLQPPVDAWRGPVALSPDGARLAFRVERLPGIYDICVAEVGAESHRVVVTGDRRASPYDILWSPSGRRLAYLTSDGAGGRGVGHCDASASGAAAVRTGVACAWLHDESGLVVFDARAGALVEIGAGSDRVIAELEDDGDLLRPPIVVSDAIGAQHAVVCHRRETEAAYVWLVDRASGAKRLVTDVPQDRAVKVAPAFSPDGRDLAVHIVLPRHKRSALIVFRDGVGGGDVVYVQDHLDVPELPAWSPSGKHLAFFATPRAALAVSGEGPAALALLDLDDKQLRLIGEPGAYAGRCRFLDASTLVVDGPDGAHRHRFDTAL